MTRCANPLLFAGIVSLLFAQTGGHSRLIIGYKTSENQDATRDGVAVIEASGGYALLILRTLPAPLTAFSMRMVIADGAVYVRVLGEALIYLNGHTVDHSHEDTLAPDAELALTGKAVTTYGGDSSLPCSLEGQESVDDGMVGACTGHCTLRIVSLEPSGARGISVLIDGASELLATLLDHLGVPVVKEGTGFSLSVFSNGRTLSTSVPEKRVRSALEDVLSTSPAVPTDPGLYYVDPAFVLGADALCMGVTLAVLRI